MSYYDNVKENIRSRNAGNSENEEGDGVTGNFDSLKEAAQENQNEEEEGDDTPIEVLEEDGISTESPSQKRKKQQQQQRQQSTQQSQEENPLKQKASNNGAQASTEADISRVEDKLDRIIEQNDELIEILRSFAQ